MRNHRERANAIMNRLLDKQGEGEKASARVLGRVWREQLRAFKRKLFAVLLFSLPWAAMPFVWPFTSRFLVDDVLQIDSNAPQSDLATKTHLVFVFGAICFATWAIWLIANYARSRIMISVGRDLVHNLRERLHTKLQRLHIGFYERTPAGVILNRVLDDVNVILEWTTASGVNLFSSVVKICIGMGVLFYLEWDLALIALASIPAYAFCFRAFRPRIARAQLALRKLNARMYALSSERIAGVKVVKAFDAVRREVAKFTLLVNDSTRLRMRAVVYGHTLVILSGVVAAVTAGGILYLTALRVRAGEMSLGGLMAFYIALRNLNEPVNQMATLMTQLQGFFVVVRRVFGVLDEKEDVVTGRVYLSGIDGRAELDRVTFTYPDKSEPALRDVSIKIAPGERIALVGPSGSGKSTVFQLLMRFYDPQQGAVRVGGVDLTCADSGSVRRHVCMVQQEPVVFSGTLGDAILYGRLDASPGQIMKAAERAELHEYIMSLDLKYETEVGENGVTLSGGQKQRLALATALLTEPEILLLDDTTSALDAATEAKIRATLIEVLKGRTSVIITQRVATARDCDRIVVLEKGVVTACGTHADLSSREGFYRRICRQQESQ